MFSIRAEKHTQDNEFPDYCVYEADVYEVTKSIEPDRAEVKMFDGGDSFFIFIGAKEPFVKAYVMNADGKTVDTIMA